MLSCWRCCVLHTERHRAKQDLRTFQVFPNFLQLDHILVSAGVLYTIDLAPSTQTNKCTKSPFLKGPVCLSQNFDKQNLCVYHINLFYCLDLSHESCNLEENVVFFSLYIHSLELLCLASDPVNRVFMDASLISPSHYSISPQLPLRAIWPLFQRAPYWIIQGV